MTPTPESFLASYDMAVFNNAMYLREIIHQHLPNVTEQVDVPAKMIAYCYGQRYVDMICTIFPSKKGLKLGFSRGNELPDPEALLEGNGKISRYVVIRSKEMIDSNGLKQLLIEALEAYKKRIANL